MISLNKKNEGFTLIELMIVVAIIGILAAIAIPNFLKFQLRSKASEGKVNLAAIRTAQEATFAEVGTYYAWVANPVAAPGQVKSDWNNGGAPLCPTPPTPADPGFCLAGWEPEGDVYYQYTVATNAALPLPSNQFFGVGASDIDGDGTVNVWGIQKPDQAGAFGIAATSGCTNVVNPANQALFIQDQVGPCDNAQMGRNIF